jgi:hypothetical protein
VAGRVIGAKEAVKSVNAYLGILEQQLLDGHTALIRDYALITAETYKDSYDRANTFKHRKPLRGGPEGRPQD